jgi:hypothetical protein
MLAIELSLLFYELNQNEGHAVSHIRGASQRINFLDLSYTMQLPDQCLPKLLAKLRNERGSCRFPY